MPKHRRIRSGKGISGGKSERWGVDGAAVLGWGEKQSVLVAVDLGTGEPIALANIDEKELPALERFLADLKQRLGVCLIVTDDLFTYRVAAERLQLGHQVCQFHARRWVGKALREFRRGHPGRMAVCPGRGQRTDRYLASRRRQATLRLVEAHDHSAIGSSRNLSRPLSNCGIWSCA